MKKSRIVIGCLLAAAVSLIQTGCLKRSSGGMRTRAAMELLEEGDASAALEGFTQALEANESPVMALRGKGLALMAQARFAEAVQAFTQALEATDEKMPKTRRDLKLYLATARYRQEEWEQVIELCTQLLEEQEQPEVYYLQGSAYLAKGEQENARESFDQAAARSAGDYAMYLRIYECYERENLTAVGDEYLQTALGIVPEGAADQYEIGRIYYYLEQYEQARDALREPVEENYIPAIRLMGEVYLAMGDSAHAVAMYQLILDEEGETPLAYNGLALCALAAGNYDEAVSWIEKGLSLDEEEGKQQLRFNEMIAYERKLDFAAALVKAEAYMTLYPTDEAGKKELTFLRTRN